MSKKTDQNGEAYRFNYDPAGNLVEERDPNGNVKTFTYNELDQLTRVQYPDDLIVMTYDDRNDLRSVENNTSLLTYQYDSRSRPLVSTFQGKGTLWSLGYSLSAQYDSNGNRTRLNSPYGVVTSTFDNGNKMTSLSSAFGGGFAFGYDQARRLASTTRPGTTTEINYTESSIVSSISHKSGSTVRSFFEYAYDLRNIPIQKRSVAGTFNYGYDLSGQLTSADSVTGTETFDYDGIGNRIQSGADSLTYDDPKQRLISDGSYTYGYDRNGNLIFKNPSRTGLKAYNFSYNSKNQLTGVDILTTAAGQVEKSIRYQYDAAGRRIERSVTDSQNSSNSYTRRYILDGDDILAEVDASNNTLAIYTHSKLSADDMLSVQITATGAALGLASQSGTYYFLKDALGSVTDITNSSGGVVQRYEYSSFGKILRVSDGSGNDVTSSPLIKTSFTYTGREYEPETGLYYYRARYYDPGIGRFLQKDPHPGNTGIPITVVNKYSYVGNNPIGRTDPTGLSWISDFFGGSGGFVGDLITAAVTVGVLIAYGVSAGPALLAVASVAGGALVASMTMAAFQGGDFWKNTGSNFHYFFRVGATFLAGSAIFAPGGVAAAGGNGLQGYVLPKEPYFGSATGLTIGSASTYNVGSGFAAHEFGHTLQFIGLSGLAGWAGTGPEQVSGTYLALGALGAVAPNGAGAWWENMASRLGSSF